MMGSDGCFRPEVDVGEMNLPPFAAADRYHVCGLTVGNDSNSNNNNNNNWTGVTVGADHHLRRYFRAAGLGMRLAEGGGAVRCCRVELA